MDLILVMDQLRPGENVSPDLSSYNAMIANWRGSGTPPTLQEVNAKWVQIEPDILKGQEDVVVEKELVVAGADQKAMVDALWEKIMNADSTKADALKVIIDQIKI